MITDNLRLSKPISFDIFQRFSWKWIFHWKISLQPRRLFVYWIDHFFNISFSPINLPSLRSSVKLNFMDLSQSWKNRVHSVAAEWDLALFIVFLLKTSMSWHDIISELFNLFIFAQLSFWRIVFAESYIINIRLLIELAL